MAASGAAFALPNCRDWRRAECGPVAASKNLPGDAILGGSAAGTTKNHERGSRYLPLAAVKGARSKAVFLPYRYRQAGRWRPQPRTPCCSRTSFEALGKGIAALRRKATISTSLSGPAHDDRFCQKGRVTSLHNHDGP